MKWITFPSIKVGTVWMEKEKQEPTTHCLQETHFGFKVTDRLKVKDGKRYSRQAEARGKRW